MLRNKAPTTEVHFTISATKVRGQMFSFHISQKCREALGIEDG